MQMKSESNNDDLLFIVRKRQQKVHDLQHITIKSQNKVYNYKIKVAK